MAQLRLISLTCYETEDNWGSDHAYILVNGNKVWGPTRINDNQRRDLTGVQPIPFTTRAEIELWEKDDLDPDDFLGTSIARAARAGKGELRAYFDLDDARYRLIYEVLP